MNKAGRLAPFILTRQDEMEVKRNVKKCNKVKRRELYILLGS